MRSLPLEVTTACNFSCLHCSREKNAPRREMALPFFQGLLDEGKKLGIDAISITGGEPLLRRTFILAHPLILRHSRASLFRRAAMCSWVRQPVFHGSCAGRTLPPIPLDARFPFVLHKYRNTVRWPAW